MKFPIAFLFSFLFFFSQTSDAQTLLKRAEKEYELHAYNLAVQSFLKAIEKEPYTAETLGKLADSYRMLGQMDQAEQWYEKASKMEGLPPVYTFHYGEVLLAQGQYGKAKEKFAAYGKTDPVAGNHFEENSSFAMSRMSDPSAFKIKNLSINSTSSDFGPAFFQNKLVFTSSRPDIKKQGKEKTWAGDAQNQLFTADRDAEGNLGSISLLHADLKSAYNEGPLSYSPDGKAVVFTKNNFVEGTRFLSGSGMQLSIFMAEVDSKGDWTNPKPFPHNGSGYSSGFPSFSPDGNALYFASDRPDGFGGYDLFVSYRFGNNWTTPENLGPVVNTKGDEITPFFDGKNLYFSSNWHPGFGGYDVFRSEKNGMNWDKIFNLGTGINSSRDDLGFIFKENENTGYLTSNRVGGKGLEDIYGISKVTGELIVMVKDAATGKPVSGATVDLSNCGEGTLVSNEQGKVVKQTLKGLNCSGSVTKEGYRAEIFKLETLGNTVAQSFEIVLKKEGEVYAGKVLNAINMGNLSDVTIKITNQNNGITTSVNSAADGSYTAALSPNTNYLVRYSKAGFVEVSQTVKTNDGADKSILGVVSLAPVGALANSGKTEEKMSGKTASPAPAADAAASKKAAFTEQPVTIAAKSGSTTLTGPGYAVQLASVNASPEISTASFYDKLGGLGNIYVVQENKFAKIRLGVYGAKEDAQNAQNKAAELGFPGTFIVADNGPLFGAISNEVIKITENTAGNSGDKNYKIRLAAVKETKWADDSKIKNLGTIETRPRGEWTILLLSGFDNLSEARSALEQAKSAGFKDAYVVTDNNGELKRVD